MLRARGRKYSPKKGPEAGSIRTKIRSQLGILHNTGNKDVYKGPFAKHLASIGVDMTCAYQKVHKQKMPSSHQSGSLPIMGIFVKPYIICERSFIVRYGYSVGNHRGPHCLDISLESVLGTNDPPLR